MKIFSALKRALFPRRCALCKAAVYPSERLCKSCGAKMRPGRITRQLLPGIPCASPFRYETYARELLLKLKHEKYSSYSEYLGECMAETIRVCFKGREFSALCCVPKDETGDSGVYNQSRLLAMKVGEVLNIPFLDCLTQLKKKRPQHGIARALEREKNVSGCYFAKKELVAGKNILIIDDIVTSGATLRECAKCLVEAGAAGVAAAAAADRALL